MNTQLMFPLDIPPVRFTICAAIRHWSSGCHNKNGYGQNMEYCQAWFTLGVKVHKMGSKLCELVEQP